MHGLSTKSARGQHEHSTESTRGWQLDGTRSARGQQPDSRETAAGLLAIPNHQLGNVTIRKALPSDLTYIDALQRKHVNNTGFVPKKAIENHLERNSYSLLNINGDPVGYLMAAGGIRKPFRLIQVNIQSDAWRTGLGTILIALALAEAQTKPKPNMTATVRDGLPMNPVVLATGARIDGYDHTPKARNRKLIHYTWDTTAPRRNHVTPERQPHAPFPTLPPGLLHIPE